MTTNTLNDTVYNDPNLTATKSTTVDPGGNEYDYVLSVFLKVMKDDVAAANFTQSIYEVASATGVPVLTIIDTLKDQDLMTLTASMAYYLNSIRSPATLLGVNQLVKPNYYAARNVLS